MVMLFHALIKASDIQFEANTIGGFDRISKDLAVHRTLLSRHVDNLIAIHQFLPLFYLSVPFTLGECKIVQPLKISLFGAALLSDIGG